MWLVYTLRCADGSFHVGETKDVSTRLADRNRGRGGSHTAKRRPVTLVYVEEHVSRAVSVERERQIRLWTQRKKEALIGEDKLALKKA